MDHKATKRKWKHHDIERHSLGTVKAGLIHRQQWPTKDAARTAIFEYLEAFYNRRRLHSALGYEVQLTTKRLQFKELPWRGEKVSRHSTQVPN